MVRVIYLNIIPILMFANNINLEIQNIKSIKGDIFIGLYTERDNFTDTTNYFKSAVKKVDSNNIKHTFNHIPNGKYAISVFQDTNNNKKHDKNFFGVPTEPYGFSNNPTILFSKPSFEECSFILNKNKTIKIVLEE